MTPLPAAIRPGAKPRSIVAWRLERTAYLASWDRGIGAEKVGGRWSPKGTPVIYASLDPATTILEVAVHAGFETLDTVPHTLVSFEILSPKAVHVVNPQDVPNPNWLRPGGISAGQQAFGLDLLQRHPFVLVPSVVSPHSWNLLVNPASAAGKIKVLGGDAFALDARLHPAL